MKEIKNKEKEKEISKIEEINNIQKKNWTTMFYLLVIILHIEHIMDREIIKQRFTDAEDTTYLSNIEIYDLCMLLCTIRLPNEEKNDLYQRYLERFRSCLIYLVSRCIKDYQEDDEETIKRNIKVNKVLEFIIEMLENFSQNMRTSKLKQNTKIIIEFLEVLVNMMVIYIEKVGLATISLIVEDFYYDSQEIYEVITDTVEKYFNE